MRLFIDFVPLLLWMGLVTALVIVMLLASWVLRPHVLQNSEKTSTYECGEEPLGPARISFPYSYIIYTVLFLVVDVMGAFMWLYAVSALRTSVFVVWQVVVFAAVIMAAVMFVLKILPKAQMTGPEVVALYEAAKEQATGLHSEG